MENVLKRNKAVLAIAILIIFFVFIFYQENTNLLAFSCGDEPINFKNIDISSNPNFVFENDPTYTAVQLFDKEENTVFVNSYIECKHYVEGGWYKKANNDDLKKPKTSIYKNFGTLILILIVISYNQSLSSKGINRNNIFNFLPIIFFSVIYLFIQSKLITRGLYFPILENNQIFKMVSLFLLTCFLYLISKTINYIFKLSSISLALTYFLLSFFAFDFLLLPFTKNISFQQSFLIVISLWIVLFLYKKVRIKILFFLGFLYLIIFLFNNSSNAILKDSVNYKILNSDVLSQWLPLVSSVHDNNLYFAYENSLIDGYGMLLSYVQAVIHKIIFLNPLYEFSTLDSNLILLFSIFLFIDLDIAKHNRLLLCFTYFLIILDDGWLRFLMGNSLMQEGLVSFLFTAFVMKIVKSKLQNATFFNNLIYILLFSFLILSKQFIETLVILLLLYIFRIVKNRLIIIPFAILFTLIQIYNTLYFNSVAEVEYIDKPLREVFYDIVFLKNPNWENVFKIVSKIFEFKFIFFALLLILLFAKNTDELSRLMILIIGFNILFILLLYVFIWQNIETDSSFRYLMNTGHLIFISLFTQLDNYQKKKITY